VRVLLSRVALGDGDRVSEIAGGADIAPPRTGTTLLEKPAYEKPAVNGGDYEITGTALPMTHRRYLIETGRGAARREMHAVFPSLSASTRHACTRNS
jgi:hypothetical protein